MIVLVGIDITIEAGEWDEQPRLHEQARQAIEAAIAEVGVALPKGTEVSVVFGNDAMVKELNRDWRDKDKPTNVLSFAANDGLAPPDWSPLLGDIVLAQETIVREAKEQGKAVEAHLTHLIVHGFLHLLGYDHENDDEADTMEQIETRALARLGIADPYQDT
ncbi:rRNA maturation RNase YbeY [Pseudahrensia aquimaris]|uniref:Endoribonuclease YbeY n=1 Tax=Pseudahrensia aquimaris TaxID=744461 RepID=A0ABW3FHL4_9HYPH